jgi:hypothetical protein
MDQRKLIAVALVVGVLLQPLLFAQKPQQGQPPAAQAPAEEKRGESAPQVASPQSAPSQEPSQGQLPDQSTPPTAQATEAEKPTSTQKAATKKKSHKKRSSKKTSARLKRSSKKSSKRQKPKVDPAAPRRIVVRNGGTDPGGQLQPGMSAGDAQAQRARTQQLLQLADVNLKVVTGRALTPDQQDMVRQINMYMEQSRRASDEGDLVRARNLAVKARLLSDALVRQ